MGLVERTPNRTIAAISSRLISKNTTKTATLTAPTPKRPENSLASSRTFPEGRNAMAHTTKAKTVNPPPPTIRSVHRARTDGRHPFQLGKRPANSRPNRSVAHNRHGQKSEKAHSNASVNLASVQACHSEQTREAKPAKVPGSPRRYSRLRPGVCYARRTFNQGC